MHYDQLCQQFTKARTQAVEFAERHNDALPWLCPGCCEPYYSGIECPDCGYLHETSIALVLDCEFGYDVVAFNNRRNVFARFWVEYDGLPVTI